MNRSTRRQWPAGAIPVFLVLVLAGCGSEADDGSGSPTAPATTGAPATGTRVTAELGDFSVTLSESSFSVGDYTFVAEQVGESPHALTVTGPGVDATTPVIQPGEGSEELTVNLPTGTYELWCPVSDHRALGMTVTITVS